MEKKILLPVIVGLTLNASYGMEESLSDCRYRLQTESLLKQIEDERLVKSEAYIQKENAKWNELKENYRKDVPNKICVNIQELTDEYYVINPFTFSLSVKLPESACEQRAKNINRYIQRYNGLALKFIDAFHTYYYARLNEQIITKLKEFMHGTYENIIDETEEENIFNNLVVTMDVGYGGAPIYLKEAKLVFLPNGHCYVDEI